MAGVKGRSGGARPNSGPKKKPPVMLPENFGQKLAELVVAQAAPMPDQSGDAPDVGAVESQPVQAAASEVTPLEFLLTVMRDPMVEAKLRLEAAKTAAQYMHLKKGDGGIKDERAEKAKKAASGKFGAAPPPKLIVNNR